MQTADIIYVEIDSGVFSKVQCWTAELQPLVLDTEKGLIVPSTILSYSLTPPAPALKAEVAAPRVPGPQLHGAEVLPTFAARYIAATQPHEPNIFRDPTN